MRGRSLLQIRLFFVRETRETGIKILSIHSDDGLNTNLELRFCSAFFYVRVFNPYAPSNRQPLIAKARPTMLAFRLVDELAGAMFWYIYIKNEKTF